MPKRALIVANGQFKDKRIAALASPVSDGKRLQALLQRADVGDYEVKLCADADTSAVKIAVERFFDSADHDDLLVLLISGHGKKDKRGNLYFLTRDTDLDALSATAVEARFFTDRMNESAASKQIVFVDTCYSGAFVKDANFKSVDVDVRADDMLRDSALADDAEGKAIIMASAGHQLAQEKGKSGSEPVQSLFTRHLIEGIETGQADPEGTGRITLDNLYTHCRRGLKRDGGGQEPEWRLSRLSGQFEIARNPVAQTALPQDLQARMARPERDIRAGTIDELRALAEGPDMLQRRRATEALRQLALDDTVLVATAATLALRKLGISEPDSGAADAARDDRERQERAFEARMQRERDVLAQASREAAERELRLREQEERALQRQLREAEAGKQAGRDRADQTRADQTGDHSKAKPKGTGWLKWAAGGLAAIVGVALVVDSQNDPQQVYDGSEPTASVDAAANGQDQATTSDPSAQSEPPYKQDAPVASAAAVQAAPIQQQQDQMVEQFVQAAVLQVRPMLPRALDAVTIQSAVRSEGKTLIHTYDVGFDPTPEQRLALDATRLAEIRQSTCNPVTAPLFEAGMRMVSEYRFPASPVMRFTLTSCDPDQAASQRN